MLLYNARKSNSGFTLIEMLVVFIIIGVIAAIAAPNFLGLLNRNRVNDAAQQVEGALKEAQRQAMRQGKQCTINIDTTNKIISNPTTTPPTNGCLLSSRNLDLVQLNSNTTSIVFSGKGNISGTAPVFVVSMPNGTSQRKCVVLEGVLGTLRSGDYDSTGTIPATPVSTSCQ
ncbi:MAG: type II secretion system protein [Pleurocapsa sp. SU_5_0]|nr:type II secretion system protein [Pleurocapsa sp. SU_5_0]